MPTRSALLARLVLAAGLPLAGCASSDPPPAASVPPPATVASPATGAPPTAAGSVTLAPPATPTSPRPPASQGRPPNDCPPGQTYQVGLTPTGPVGGCMPLGAVPGRALRVASEVRVAGERRGAVWG